MSSSSRSSQQHKLLERTRQQASLDAVRSAVPITPSLSVMHSTAIQSDLVKKYSLSMPSRSIAMTKPRRKHETSSSQYQGAAPSSSMSSSSATQAQQATGSSWSRVGDATPIACPSCDFDNEPGSTVCACCGFFLTVARQHRTTLAQKLGICEGPKSVNIITISEWEAIDAKAAERDEAFCPICMIGFNQGSEVLLSCSHVFHQACILSFERFSSSKQRSCPICRATDYQKRMTNKGSKAFHIVCAIKVQSLFRGYICRKSFRTHLRAYYRQNPVNNPQRRKFFEQEFSLCTDEMHKQLDKRGDEVRSIISNMDNTLMESRQLDAIFETMMAQRRELNHYSMIQFDHDGIVDVPAVPRISRDAAIKVPNIVESIDWIEIVRTAESRGWDECPICMGSSEPPSFGKSISYCRQVVILSCSHVFHLQCIENFEKFSVFEENRVCPICRCSYEKHVIEQSELSKPAKIPASASHSKPKGRTTNKFK